MNKFLKSLYFLGALLLGAPVYAQPRLSGGDGAVSVGTMVDNLLNYLFPLAGVICVIFVIQGGYMWMISAGDPAKLKQAQGTLTWAILGLVFVMLILGLLKLLVEFVSE